MTRNDSAKIKKRKEHPNPVFMKLEGKDYEY